jgi:hypothetical protein
LPAARLLEGIGVDPTSLVYGFANVSGASRRVGFGRQLSRQLADRVW